MSHRMRELRTPKSLTHSLTTSQSLLDGGTLESYLTEVNTWVQANPTEGQSAPRRHVFQC